MIHQVFQFPFRKEVSHRGIAEGNDAMRHARLAAPVIERECDCRYLEMDGMIASQTLQV